jgi:hypothetical protein
MTSDMNDGECVDCSTCAISERVVVTKDPSEVSFSHVADSLIGYHCVELDFRPPSSPSASSLPRLFLPSSAEAAAPEPVDHFLEARLLDATGVLVGQSGAV